MIINFIERWVAHRWWWWWCAIIIILRSQRLTNDDPTINIISSNTNLDQIHLQNLDLASTSQLNISISNKFKILTKIQLHKVNRCLARYSPRASTTNWPTNRAPNMPAWPGPNWPNMPIFFTGEIKSFVTHITENPPRHLFHIVFWSGIGQNVQKMAIFGPKWPKMQILDQVWPFFGQKS